MCAWRGLVRARVCLLLMGVPPGRHSAPRPPMLRRHPLTRPMHAACRGGEGEGNGEFVCRPVYPLTWPGDGSWCRV